MCAQRHVVDQWMGRTLCAQSFGVNTVRVDQHVPTGIATGKSGSSTSTRPERVHLGPAELVHDDVCSVVLQRCLVPARVWVST